MSIAIFAQMLKERAAISDCLSSGGKRYGTDSSVIIIFLADVEKRLTFVPPPFYHFKYTAITHASEFGVNYVFSRRSNLRY